jgi:hypothetical protein
LEKAAIRNCNPVAFPPSWASGKSMKIEERIRMLE